MGGGPRYFCDLGAHAKFHNPNCLLSSRKESALERRKKKMPSTMTTSLRWRTNSVRTKIFSQSQTSQTQLRRIFPIDNNARIERMWHLITTIASPPKQDQAGGSHQLTIMVELK